MYMLEGGTDASNTDPYATKPTAENNWIKTGPHIMVVGSKEILAGHPSGPQPDTSVPYVMWAGTPYAHLMVPDRAAILGLCASSAALATPWQDRRARDAWIAPAHVLRDVAPAARPKAGEVLRRLDRTPRW